MDTKNAYAPYGYHLPDQGVLGFNGEQLDPVTSITTWVMVIEHSIPL